MKFFQQVIVDRQQTGSDVRPARTAGRFRIFSIEGGVAAKPQNLGSEDPSKLITVTVWLNQHNKAALDELVRQMYEPGSSNYHRWLTREQYRSRFAPTAEDAAQVRDYLIAHNSRSTPWTNITTTWLPRAVSATPRTPSTCN